MFTRNLKEGVSQSCESFGPRFYALDFAVKPPSVANLNPSLTINGSTKTPEFRYNAKAAAAAGWPCYDYGVTLALQSTPVPTYNCGSPLLGDIDDSLLFNYGGYFQAADTTTGDVAAEDMVLECLMQLSPTSSTTVYAKVSTYGWKLDVQASQVIRWVGYGASATKTQSSGSLSDYAWYLVHVFVDVSGSAQMYINGVASGSPASLSGMGSLTNSGHLEAGNTAGGSGPYNARVAYLAMWKGTSWLDTHLQPYIAKERFSELTGTMALSGNNKIPSVCTRSSVAYTDKFNAAEPAIWETYKVGANWPRVCVRKDNTTQVQYAGYLPEQEAINLISYSENFSTWWTQTQCTCPTTSVTPPDNRVRQTLTLHEASDTSQYHTFASPAITTAASTLHTLSAFIKAGSRTWVRLRVGDGSSSYYYCDFNLSGAGATGTTGGSPTYYKISKWGNGWYHCWVGGTHWGTTSSYVNLYSCSADNTPQYNGTDVDSLYIWGVQLEAGVGAPTSPIYTGGASATRTVDSLRYDLRETIQTSQPYIISCRVKPQNMDVPSTQTMHYMTLSDGTDNNYIKLRSSSSDNDCAELQVCSSGVEQAAVLGSNDIWDGETHPMKGIIKTDSVKLYTDYTLDGTEDTSATPPSNLTQLQVGADRSVANHSFCSIAKVRIE